jgi:hypothetical protein
MPIRLPREKARDRIQKRKKASRQGLEAFEAAGVGNYPGRSRQNPRGIPPRFNFFLLSLR